MAEAYGFQRILSDEPTKRAEQIAAYRRFHRATETGQHVSDRSRQATVIHVSEELTRLIGPRDDIRGIANAILIAQAKRRDVLSGCSFPIITGVTC